MIKSKMSALFLSALFVGVPAMVGCDREVAKETTVKTTPGGATKVEEKKTTEKADGSVETKTEKKVVDK